MSPGRGRGAPLRPDGPRGEAPPGQRLRRERLNLIFKDGRIGELNRLLAKRTPVKLIERNEALAEQGIRHKDYLDAKRDLKFNLGLQAYKSSQALALFLTIVRYAADPKAKKHVSFVKDEEVLKAANGLMREIVTHVVEEMQLKYDDFFTVGDRATREDRGILPRGRSKVPGRKV